VMKEIGGGDAEEVLAEVLGTTGRAVEVAYIAHVLEEMAPKKYCGVATEAAKSLLRNPLPIDNPNRLDDSAESYLYGVMEMCDDASFADEAVKHMVADGKLDRNARDYLLKTQGEKAIPVLYDAYKNTAFSNQWDKASVASHILDYVGSNDQANKFLSELVLNPEIDSRMRSFAIMRMAGGFGDTESPKDPKVIESRIPIVAGLAKDLAASGNADERLVRAIELTDKNLNHLLNNEPIENPFDRFRGGGDRRGGSGNGDSQQSGGGQPGGTQQNVGQQSGGTQSGTTQSDGGQRNRGQRPR
jgi:hypothetical protein